MIFTRDVMAKLKLVYLITDEGFVIYNQSFGVTEQPLDMVGDSLLPSLRIFGRVVLSEGSLSRVDSGEGADMILESGNRIIAIVVADLDKDHKEQEEYNLRNY